MDKADFKPQLYLYTILKGHRVKHKRPSIQPSLRLAHSGSFCFVSRCPFKTTRSPLTHRYIKKMTHYYFNTLLP